VSDGKSETTAIINNLLDTLPHCGGQWVIQVYGNAQGRITVEAIHSGATYVLVNGDLLGRNQWRKMNGRA